MDGWFIVGILLFFLVVIIIASGLRVIRPWEVGLKIFPVSYTHLTLPTTERV